MSEIYIEVGKNSIGQLQIAIGDGSTGYRIAGGKFDGGGKSLIRRVIDKQDADEIRRYLDKIVS